MSTILTGRLEGKTEVKVYGEKGFRKREIIIKTTNDQYEQTLLIELHQDNVDLVKGLNKGDIINVKINIQGREWVNPQGETKVFNSLVGWNIEKVQAPAQAPADDKYTIDDQDPDDLPF